MLHSTGNSKIRIVPIIHAKEKTDVKFAAEVYGVDLNSFSDEEFRIIEDALYKHKLLIFKDQPGMLLPQQQYKLTSSFDPDCPGGFAHGVEPVLRVHNGVEIHGIPSRVAIPCQPQVHVLGRGLIPPNHYQLPDDLSITGVYHKNFHIQPHIPDAEVEKGASRFYQWHFDGALYDISPPRVGCLLAVRTPKGPDCEVRWEDESDTRMKIGPGATAYLTGSSALVYLPDDLRAIAEHSSILYAPKPFRWFSKAHSSRLGHLIETENLEISLEEMGYEESKLKTYPMIWTNPKTGERSLQIHGQAALKLYLKDSLDGEVTVIDKLDEVRALMDRLMRPAIKPSNIYAHHYEEGEVVLWYNRAMWHSVTEFPDSYGPRIMHQCNVAASEDPK